MRHSYRMENKGYTIAYIIQYTHYTVMEHFKHGMLTAGLIKLGKGLNNK